MIRFSHSANSWQYLYHDEWNNISVEDARKLYDGGTPIMHYSSLSVYTIR